MSSNVCPPQKTNKLDRYLNGFFLCGLKLVTIAKQNNVTPEAVENALKRFDREAYELERSRRKKENKFRRQQKDRGGRKRKSQR